MKYILLGLISMAIILVFTPETRIDDMLFKIIGTLIFTIGILIFFVKLFNEAGVLECYENRIGIFTSENNEEFAVEQIEVMEVSIYSFVGRNVGLSLLAHHGSDNKMRFICDGKNFDFLFRIESVQQRNSIYKLMNSWTSINDRVIVKKGF